jgi:hypothetical protein
VDSAFRYGGDEFLVLLPETDIVGAFVVAEKIRSQAEEIGDGPRDDASTSVSIGLVSHPEDGASVEELMIAADRAMYAAKRLGKNQISGYPRPRRGDPSTPRPQTGSPSAPMGQPTSPDAPDDRDGGPTPAIAPGSRTPVAVGAADAEDAGRTGSRHEVASTRAPTELPRPTGSPRTTDESPEEEELDPAEARRRIATLSYDSDHQVRRAMNAFLGAPDQHARDRERGDERAS